MNRGDAESAEKKIQQGNSLIFLRALRVSAVQLTRCEHKKAVRQSLYFTLHP